MDLQIAPKKTRVVSAEVTAEEAFHIAGWLADSLSHPPKASAYRKADIIRLQAAFAEVAADKELET